MSRIVDASCSECRDGDMCACWHNGADWAEEAEQESLRANSTELRRACDELSWALREANECCELRADGRPCDTHFGYVDHAARRLLALCAPRAPLPGEGR